MKKFLTLCLATALLVSSLPLMGCNKDTPKEETPTSMVLVKDSASEYTIVRDKGAAKKSPELSAVLVIKNAILDATGVELNRSDDWIKPNDPASAEAAENGKEILVGHTNRKESTEAIKDLKEYEFIIKAMGNKLVICGGSETATLSAANFFAANCVTAGAVIELPLDYEYKGIIDMTASTTHNMFYTDMGAQIIAAYAENYFDRRGKLINTEFWDTAEIMEAMLDAYEQTGNQTYLTYAENIATGHFNADNPSANHLNNMYNDDLAWMIIGLTRLYNFTGKTSYLKVAQNNFDQMYQRAYSPNVMGGGLWWKHDQQNTKNSCIQCPASIAACLLGKTLGDDSYYEKAKLTMEWEFANLFDSKTGRVYDAINTDGGCSTWASSYNQGTFVGACMLLHEKYGDQKYLDYAAKAANFGMYSLGNVDGVLSGEDTGADLPGFKGILTRWFYRYAEYVGDVSVLSWLQMNADAAFGNRNQYNMIWSNWANPTEDKKNLDPWGVSAAVALLFNCEQWW